MMAKEKKKKTKKRMTLLQKRSMKGYLFILPWFIGFVCFYVRSIFLTGRFSFSELKMDASAGGYSLTGVGFDNFIYAFRVHPTFKQIITTSVMDMLIDVPLIIFFSLFVAMLLNKHFPGIGLVRALFFLPVILNTGAITAALDLSAAMMNGGVSSQIGEMASGSSGSVAFSMNYLIEMFVNLGVPSKLLGYIVNASGRIYDIVRASGVQIVIFIAALQSISPSMYEVARIEGATAYETFWKVTFPLVMPHIITNVVYTIVDSFTHSEVVDLAYQTAFTNFDYGLSAVFSIV